MQKQDIRLVITGSNGKMGRALLEKITSHDSGHFLLVGTYSKADNIKELKSLCQNADVVIDFSHPDLLKPLIEYAIAYGTRLVIGTTGLDNQQLKLISDAANHLPIIYSANMSLGANLVTLLATKAAQLLGSIQSPTDNYDIAIIDKHHRAKIDSPSGTALMISKAISDGQAQDKIAISSIRAGGMYGEHEILFANSSEIIALKHQALNRNSYVQGALAAARWITEQPNGLYSMLNVFNKII